MPTARTQGRTMVSSNADMRCNTGMGLSHAERRKMKVICPKCGTEVGSASLIGHQSTQKCKKLSKSFHPTTPQKERARFEKTVVTPMMDPTIYQVSIPNKSTEIDCPHPGCFKTTPQRVHCGSCPSSSMIIVSLGCFPLKCFLKSFRIWYIVRAGGGSLKTSRMWTINFS